MHLGAGCFIRRVCRSTLNLRMRQVLQISMQLVIRFVVGWFRREHFAILANVLRPKGLAGLLACFVLSDKPD
jgi:hypothetical protein